MKKIFLIFTLCLISELQTVNPSLERENSTLKSEEISFEINVDDTSIVLEQVKIPETMKVYFLLSNAAADINWETLTGYSLSPGGFDKGVVLDGFEKDQMIRFEKLQTHTSYRLYYFSEDKETQQRTEVLMYEIETRSSLKKSREESKVNLPTKSRSLIEEVFDYEFLKTMASVCIPGFVICLISLFLQKMDQVPDECFSFDKNYSHQDDSKHEVPKILNVRSKSFFRLLEKCESTGRQEEKNLVISNKIIEAENQELEERRLCGICCQRSREIIFLSCGHAYCCYACSLSLNVCPIDQKPISMSLKFSMSMNYQAECCSNDLAASLYSSTETPRNYEKEMLLKLQNSFIKKLMKCAICNKKNKDTFFLNCGHMICCNSCSKDLVVCPFDYVPITKIYQAYFP